VCGYVRTALVSLLVRERDGRLVLGILVFLIRAMEFLIHSPQRNVSSGRAGAIAEPWSTDIGQL
jgi:hypothetical protein